jgi:hypothetical protein
MNTTRSKVATIVIAVYIIMHFCVVNDIVRFHLLVTTVAYSLLAFYFFPLAVVLDIIKIKEKREVLYSLMSGFVFANILCFLVIQQLLPDNHVVHNILSVFKLINGVLVYVYFFVKSDRDRVFWHVLFVFFQ